jgi:hypothetical protein
MESDVKIHIAALLTYRPEQAPTVIKSRSAQRALRPTHLHGQNTYHNLNRPVLAKRVAPTAPAASTAPIPIDWYETIVSSTTRPICVILLASSDSAVEPLRV